MIMHHALVLVLQDTAWERPARRGSELGNSLKLMTSNLPSLGGQPLQQLTVPGNVFSTKALKACSSPSSSLRVLASKV